MYVSYMVNGDVNQYNPLGKQFGNVDQKSLTIYTFDPVIPLQGIYLKEIIRDVDRDLCYKDVHSSVIYNSEKKLEATYTFNN